MLPEKLPKKVRSKYQVVVGLEVHVQLATDSKIFSPDATAYGGPPNTNISAITLGHPGTMPRINRQAVAYAIRMGLACGCSIAQRTVFARKNYFYPDLPKGYQIMQDKTPICRGGEVTITTSAGERRVALHHIHLEEDAGKSMHLADEPETLVDLNRAGVALIEIVTEPALHSSEEAYALLTEVRRMVRYLDICDGNMEEGSIRCDANVSVMLREATKLGKKVEVKNMNSMRNVQRAIDFETQRQIAQLEDGQEVVSETRTFDAVRGTTASMRTKEELNDYRYFPEPDLSPLEVSDAWLADIRAAMPLLPHDYRRKFVDTYGLPAYNAEVLTDTKESAQYFEQLCQHTTHHQAASNWMMGPVRSFLNEQGTTLNDFPLSPLQLASLVDLVAQNTVSFAVASQRLFPTLLASPERPVRQLAQELNLLQDSNVGSLQPLIDEMLDSLPDKVAAYQQGKKGLLGMFMGELMKRSRGKANPKLANELLRKSLEEA
ncbi:MAG: Asp-tRNA(Asn)/Glu-tRNA(Gln) amidotransferase subunit GatB [Tunicatimonas sp.]